MCVYVCMMRTNWFSALAQIKGIRIKRSSECTADGHCCKTKNIFVHKHGGHDRIKRYRFINVKYHGGNYSSNNRLNDHFDPISVGVHRGNLLGWNVDNENLRPWTLGSGGTFPEIHIVYMTRAVNLPGIYTITIIFFFKPISIFNLFYGL